MSFYCILFLGRWSSSRDLQLPHFHRSGNRELKTEFHIVWLHFSTAISSLTLSDKIPFNIFVLISNHRIPADFCRRFVCRIFNIFFLARSTTLSVKYPVPHSSDCFSLKENAITKNIFPHYRHIGFRYFRIRVMVWNGTRMDLEQADKSNLSRLIKLGTSRLVVRSQEGQERIVECRMCVHNARRICLPGEKHPVPVLTNLFCSRHPDWLASVVTK